MEFRTEKTAGRTIVRLAGDIDGNNAGDFEAHLLPVIGQLQGQDLIIELTDVNFMSSAGLRVLMKAAKSGKPCEVGIVLVGPSRILLEILKISRFDRLFPIRDTLEEALAAD